MNTNKHTSTPERVDSETRKGRILGFIHANPGATPQDVSTATGIPLLKMERILHNLTLMRQLTATSAPNPTPAVGYPVITRYTANVRTPKVVNMVRRTSSPVRTLSDVEVQRTHAWAAQLVGESA